MAITTTPRPRPSPSRAAPRLAAELRRLTRAILKRWSPRTVRALIWDGEFSRGTWDVLDETTGDVVYRYIIRIARGGDILDLGCGGGNTGNELPVEAYRHYTGVDISREAVERAIGRSRQNGRAAKNSYLVADLLEHAPAARYDLILFRESLYYVPASRVGALLERYSRYLAPGGAFLVRMYDGRKFRRIQRVIARHFEMIEHYSSPAAGTVLLVFQPRA